MNIKWHFMFNAKLLVQVNSIRFFFQVKFIQNYHIQKESKNLTIFVIAVHYSGHSIRNQFKIHLSMCDVVSLKCCQRIYVVLHTKSALNANENIFYLWSAQITISTNITYIVQWFAVHVLISICEMFLNSNVNQLLLTKASLLYKMIEVE